jgi:pilus assembly protein Flp/PilA
MPIAFHLLERPAAVGVVSFFSRQYPINPFPTRRTDMLEQVLRFLKDGPTAVEYAVMLALIIVVCIAAISTLGSNANGTFNFVASKVSSNSGS